MFTNLNKESFIKQKEEFNKSIGGYILNSLIAHLLGASMYIYSTPLILKLVGLLFLTLSGCSIVVFAVFGIAGGIFIKILESEDESYL